MELPKMPDIKMPDFGRSFGDIKSRLGFGDAGHYQDEAYADYSDGYHDQYSEEFDPAYAEYAEYADHSEYSDYSDYDDRYAPLNDSGASRARGEVTTPRLVSIDDVRRRTQSSEGIGRDSLRTSQSSRTSALGNMSRATSESDASAYPSYSGETSRASHSEGLDSLFTPSGDTSAPAKGYDPYEAYSGARASHTPSRVLSVMKPSSYAEVENIARILKTGDVAVLCLGNTPDDLAKRILDFTFGVACYAEARVDCVADKVFVVARGSELSADEIAQLRRQGVL